MILKYTSVKRDFQWTVKWENLVVLKIIVDF